MGKNQQKKVEPRSACRRTGETANGRSVEHCLACEAEAVGTLLDAFMQFLDRRSQSPTAIGLASEAALHGAERRTPNAKRYTRLGMNCVT